MTGIVARLFPGGHEEGVQGDESSAEIHELLKRAGEIFGEPQAKAELKEHKQAPHNRQREKARRVPGLEELDPCESGGGQSEGEHFGEGEYPEGDRHSGEPGKKGCPKLIVKPGRHAGEQLADAGEAPDHKEEEVDGEQGGATDVMRTHTRILEERDWKRERVAWDVSGMAGG